MQKPSEAKQSAEMARQLLLLRQKVIRIHDTLMKYHTYAVWLPRLRLPHTLLIYDFQIHTLAHTRTPNPNAGSNAK